MKKLISFILLFSFLFGIQYTKKEREFLKNNPVIYISAMNYWPTDKNGESIHTNYMKLLNKYGNLNLQPVFYRYWSDGFNDAKEGVTYGIMALSYSKNRTKYFYYSKPYNYNPYYLLVNKNSNISSINDLKNKTVHVAKNSILREVLKNSKFKIINAKNSYEQLAKGKIDAILLFYVPKTKYLNQFKIIKTFINKAGEEHIGINKKYPELYSIIKKTMEVIPYSEIEKIRAITYKKQMQAIQVLQPEIKLSDLITKQDIILILLLLVGLGILLYFLLTKKFLNLQIKQFLISIFIFEIFILGFILYEILVFNYYSNKILEIKSKSFNSLYLTDKIENQVLQLDEFFKRAYTQHKNYINKLFANHYPISSNLLVENQPLKNLLVTKNFTRTELTSFAYIQKLLDELLNIQKQVLQNKLNQSIYHQKVLYLLCEFKNLKTIIKNENENEILIIKKKLKYQFLLLLFSIGMFIIESILVFIMIRKKIYNPIKYLTQVIQSCKQGNFIEKKELYYKDEFGALIDRFFSLQEQLNQKITELKLHKQNLEKEVKEEVEKRIYQEKILLKQSKMAMMGEMIDAIAHQWKQPLSTISLGVQILELEKNEITTKDLEQTVNMINMQITHMVTTLDEFREFFRDDKDKQVFCMSKVVKKVLSLLKDELLKNNISIETKIEKDFCISGIQNEFEHLLITLLTNAKDIFKERDISKRKIKIITRNDDKYYYLEVIDNAGGVPESIIDKIFELNFTNREGGTGVGLYLASQIATKHLGSLEVENVEGGAKFFFKVRGDV